jgi:hypothetical protein
MLTSQLRCVALACTNALLTAILTSSLGLRRKCKPSTRMPSGLIYLATFSHQRKPTSTSRSLALCQRRNVASKTMRRHGSSFQEDIWMHLRTTLTGVPKGQDCDSWYSPMHPGPLPSSRSKTIRTSRAGEIPTGSSLQRSGQHFSMMKRQGGAHEMSGKGYFVAMFLCGQVTFICMLFTPSLSHSNVTLGRPAHL